MPDPIEGVQAIGVTRRSPIQALPVEAPGAGSTSGLITKEGEVPIRVTPSEEGSEAQDLTEMMSRHEKMKRSMEWLPVRVSFVVDRESRKVRIRVIDASSGEIIREVPPSEKLVPESPAEQQRTMRNEK